jgi:hypothetical protein
LEIFNEFFVVADCYFLFLFTDFVADPETSYNLGWDMCIVMAISFVVNMSVILHGSVSKLIF